MKKRERIIVYGLGKAYNKLINLLRVEYEIVGVCDKNPERRVEEYPFYSVDEILDVTYDYVFITSQKYYEEIKEKLISTYKIQAHQIISQRDTWGGISSMKKLELLGL